jgi:hypothetical protein
MPSRKRSKAGRKGSRRGRKNVKRSLRFMPKLVIQERADTIENTLNATMGRTAHRIPVDVANIIQGYEGGLTVYFNIDPAFQKYTFSTNTPLREGERLNIKSTRFNHDEGPFYEFNICTIKIIGFDGNNRDMFYKYKVFIIKHMTQRSSREQDAELHEYLKNKYRDLMNRAINDLIQKGYRTQTTYSGRTKQISFEDVETYLKEVEIFNAFEEPQQNNTIIFEKIVQDISGVYSQEEEEEY